MYTDLESEEDTRSVSSDEEEGEGEEEGNENDVSFGVEDSEEEGAQGSGRNDNGHHDSESDGIKGERNSKARVTTQKEKDGGKGKGKGTGKESVNGGKKQEEEVEVKVRVAPSLFSEKRKKAMSKNDSGISTSSSSSSSSWLPSSWGENLGQKSDLIPDIYVDEENEMLLPSRTSSSSSSSSTGAAKIRDIKSVKIPVRKSVSSKSEKSFAADSSDDDNGDDDDDDYFDLSNARKKRGNGEEKGKRKAVVKSSTLKGVAESKKKEKVNEKVRASGAGKDIVLMSVRENLSGEEDADECVLKDVIEELRGAQKMSMDGRSAGSGDKARIDTNNQHTATSSSNRTVTEITSSPSSWRSGLGSLADSSNVEHTERTSDVPSFFMGDSSKVMSQPRRKSVIVRDVNPVSNKRKSLLDIESVDSDVSDDEDYFNSQPAVKKGRDSGKRASKGNLEPKIPPVKSRTSRGAEKEKEVENPVVHSIDLDAIETVNTNKPMSVKKQASVSVSSGLKVSTAERGRNSTESGQERGDTTDANKNNGNSEGLSGSVGVVKRTGRVGAMKGRDLFGDSYKARVIVPEIDLSASPDKFESNNNGDSDNSDGDRVVKGRKGGREKGPKKRYSLADSEDESGDDDGNGGGDDDSNDEDYDNNTAGKSKRRKSGVVSEPAKKTISNTNTNKNKNTNNNSSSSSSSRRNTSTGKEKEKEKESGRKRDPWEFDSGSDIEILNAVDISTKSSRSASNSPSKKRSSTGSSRGKGKGGREASRDRDDDSDDSDMS